MIRWVNGEVINANANERCAGPLWSDLYALSRSIGLNFRIFGSLPRAINAQFMRLAFFGPDRHPFPQTLHYLLSDLICLIASYWGMMDE